MRSRRDTLLRVTVDELLSHPMRHAFSGVDEGGDRIADCGRAAVITGYTEWVGTSSPPVTLGWDWRLDLVTAN